MPSCFPHLCVGSGGVLFFACVRLDTIYSLVCCRSVVGASARIVAASDFVVPLAVLLALLGGEAAGTVARVAVGVDLFEEGWFGPNGWIPKPLGGGVSALAAAWPVAVPSAAVCVSPFLSSFLFLVLVRFSVSFASDTSIGPLAGAASHEDALPECHSSLAPGSSASQSPDPSSSLYVVGRCPLFLTFLPFFITLLSTWVIANWCAKKFFTFTTEPDRLTSLQL